MHTLDKFIIGILSTGYMVASVFLVMISLGWTSPLTYAENYLLYTTSRWLLGLTGVVVFIVSLTLFLGSFRTKPVKVTAIHETSLGQIKITLPALEHLVVKAARSIQGIRDVKPLLKTMADGLSVQLKVQVLPDIGIPNITEEMQKTVKEYLLKTAGITVHEIKIVVNKITWETKSRVD